MTRIAVIGQGVMGLSSALRLMDAGFQVALFSKDAFPDTASTSAGAYWWPHRAYPQERVAGWAHATYKQYVSDAASPDTGIHFAQHLRFCIDPDDSAYVLKLIDDWQRIDGEDYGIDCAEAFAMQLPVIDVPVYMPLLKARFEARGGQIQIHEIHDFGELFPEYDLIINCSGVGAKTLANDDSVFPIRGQILRMSPSAEIVDSTRIYRKQDEFTLILPRSQDIVLGGTAQDDDWSLDVREQDSKDILDRCQQVVPALSQCQLLDAAVGLRPGRHEIRLELEMLAEHQPVIHNYGHGGGGFTVAWGCADEVAQLASAYIRPS